VVINPAGLFIGQPGFLYAIHSYFSVSKLSRNILLYLTKLHPYGSQYIILKIKSRILYRILNRAFKIAYYLLFEEQPLNVREHKKRGCFIWKQPLFIGSLFIIFQ